MMNRRSVLEVEGSNFSSRFRKPLYSTYCFSRIPGTIEKLLTNQDVSCLPSDCFTPVQGGYDMVIFFFLDAFGWCFFEKYAGRYPLLQRFMHQGIVSKITSQFPSTTAAHVTTVSTNLEVGQSGVYEWYYYEPVVDRVIAPLLFTFAGEKTLGKLEKAGIEPHMLFPNYTFYQRLKTLGVDSYVVQPENIVGSPYSKTMTKGAHPIAYYRLEEGLKTVAESLLSPSETKSFFSIYFPDIDSVGHRSGVNSQEFDSVVDRCLTAIEEELMSVLSLSHKKVACLLSADHGMVEVDPKSTIFLNLIYPELSAKMQSNKRGDLIVPAGSCRDFFLHIQPEFIDEVVATLSQMLQGKAECYPVSELIDKGFFGTLPVADVFLQRVGNVVVLPYEGESVFWYIKGKFEQNFVAAHGGLTRKEMESVFLFYAKVD